MFKPIVKQRHVGALMRMATQSGRDPNEILHELLDQATCSEAPPTPAPSSPPNGAVTSRANESPVARRARHEAVNQAMGREDGDPESAMAALEAREEKDEAEGETDEAPEHLKKGDAPNPLRRPSVKNWAGRNDDERPSFLKQNSEDEPTDDDERRAQLRRKYLAPAGRPQR